MANPNPHKARRAKAVKQQERTAGSLTDAQAVLWAGIVRAAQVMARQGQDDAMVLKSVHALQQAVSSYARLVEGVELAARVEELEREVEKMNGGKRNERT